MNKQTQELLEQRIEGLTEQVEEATAAMTKLYTLSLNDRHLDHKSDFYDEGYEDAPFFSETYLYCLLDKEDARTVLAMLQHVGKWLALDDGELFEAELTDARRMKERIAELDRTHK